MNPLSDNITDYIELIDTNKNIIINTLHNLQTMTGINFTLLSILVFLSLGAILSISLYIITRSLIISLFGISISIVFGWYIGIIPFWLTIISTIFAIFNMISILTSLFNNGQEVIEQSFNIDKWEEYGNRIKKAYDAKFGGENKGFNEEVDKRIKVMQNIRIGFTRKISRSWLKRMEDFTEVK